MDLASLPSTHSCALRKEHSKKNRDKKVGGEAKI